MVSEIILPEMSSFGNSVTISLFHLSNPSCPVIATQIHNLSPNKSNHVTTHKSPAPHRQKCPHCVTTTIYILSRNSWKIRKYLMNKGPLSVLQK